MNTFRLTLIALSAAVLMTGCRDREAEKKIAELESRLAQMESGRANPNAGVMTTPLQTVQNSQAPEQKPEGPLPSIEFETMEHDFGSVPEGKKVSFTYKFKNTGQAPLIIQGAQPSCGCTAPDWSKNPIPVGGTGFVTAEFDTKGKPGANSKTITVTANTWPKTTTLRFKANVTSLAGPAK
ncbi:MAG: DUF1573 domain-containing protein [Cyclobacteriaceae bacterium]|jgi:hypothetical protein